MIISTMTTETEIEALLQSITPDTILTCLAEHDSGAAGRFISLRGRRGRMANAQGSAHTAIEAIRTKSI